MSHLADKKIVIVGGTSGIGLSAARYFVQQGASVIAVGLMSKDLEVSEHLKFVVNDARKESTSRDAINECINTFGRFDGLYHVAGGSGRGFGDGPLHEMTLDGWNKTLELNLTSMMLSNKAAIQHFLDSKTKGSILNTSTVLASNPAPKYFSTHAYAAAKSAIIGFSKSIAAYYAPQNIRVNVLAPALTQTPMAARAGQREDIQTYIKTKQPLDGGRMAHASDLDAAACYFLSDQSQFTTAQVLAVDGGWSVSEGQYGNE